VAENCTGTSGACPADAKSTATCRPAAGDCDVAEQCTGASDTCPADAYLPRAAECRASAGTGDDPEFCSGASPTCPADGGIDTDSDGVTDDLDNCVVVPNTDQVNRDDDALGDACDPCTNLVPVFATKPKIKLTKQTTPPGDDGLKFSGAIVVPTTPAIDPATNGVRVLLTDHTGTDVVDVTIPGGTGWKTNKTGTTWSFASATGVEGITKVRVKQKKSAAGTLRFSVKGKKGAFAVATTALPVVGTFVVDSPLAKDGQCGEAMPTCRVTAKGRTIACR